MTDEDYREILRATQDTIQRTELSYIDEQIMTRDRIQRSASEDLIDYLRHLVSEIKLASNRQLREVLGRFRTYVQLDGGKKPQGIRITISKQDIGHYDVSYIDVKPDIAFDNIASDLERIIRNIERDIGRDRDRGRGMSR